MQELGQAALLLYCRALFWEGDLRCAQLGSSSPSLGQAVLYQNGEVISRHQKQILVPLHTLYSTNFLSDAMAE